MNRKREAERKKRKRTLVELQSKLNSAAKSNSASKPLFSENNLVLSGVGVVITALGFLASGVVFSGVLLIVGGLMIIAAVCRHNFFENKANWIQRFGNPFISIVVATVLALSWTLLQPKFIENKLRAFLVPSNELMATSPCSDVPSNAMIVHYGDNASFSTEDKITLLAVDNNPTLTVLKTINGLLVNLTLYDDEGSEIATIKDNKFVGRVNNNLEARSSDAHSIDIFDKNNDRHIFHIRYLNPTTIDVSGVFYFPTRKLPLIIDETGVSAFGIGIKNVCDSNFGDVGAIGFEP